MLPRLLALILLLLCSVWAMHRHGLAAERNAPDPVTLSIVGTTDLHGAVFPRDGRGGLALLGGYMKNLRAARAADGGAVLLLDAGDTFQGTVESNLSQGALVVDAYNALGYTAAAIGNHEFDFGPIDLGIPRPAPSGDPRGAIKARAAQAKYPFLAANLLDESTGRPVEWPNVQPSVMVEAAGVTVGIVGVMTIDALRATLVANTRGLRMAPLAPTIAAEAASLRSQGAQVVIVAAHAGGYCSRFDQPTDLSSCDPSSEIFEVAERLPTGLVDVIVAGHTHSGLAHQVAGIAITEAFSGGRAFGRVDVVVDRRTHRVVDVRFFPPQDLCAEENPTTQTCDAAAERAGPLVPTRYEGRVVSPDPATIEAMAPALARVRALQATHLGVVLDTPVRRVSDRPDDLESPLGNLFADAIRESVPGADVSINNNSRGGLRADLPTGPLTFGGLYDVFPFDNRLVPLILTGAELVQVFAEEIRRGRRGALGISGIRVRAGCSAQGLRVDLLRTTGRLIDAAERLLVVTTDMLATGAVFASVAPPNGFQLPDVAPIAREVVAAWLLRRGGRLRDDEFMNPAHRRWEYPDTLPAGCAAR